MENKYYLVDYNYYILFKRVGTSRDGKFQVINALNDNMTENLKENEQEIKSLDTYKEGEFESIIKHLHDYPPAQEKMLEFNEHSLIEISEEAANRIKKLYVFSPFESEGTRKWEEEVAMIRASWEVHRAI